MSALPSSPIPRAIPRLLPYVAYPLLLLLGAGLCAYTLARGLDLAVMLAVCFFAVLGLALVLERLVPFRADWRSGWVVTSASGPIAPSVVGRIFGQPGWERLASTLEQLGLVVHREATDRASRRSR